MFYQRSRLASRQASRQANLDFFDHGAGSQCLVQYPEGEQI